jgi:hypothetical protein
MVIRAAGCAKGFWHSFVAGLCEAGRCRIAGVTDPGYNSRCYLAMNHAVLWSSPGSDFEPGGEPARQAKPAIRHDDGAVEIGPGLTQNK